MYSLAHEIRGRPIIMLFQQPMEQHCSSDRDTQSQHREKDTMMRYQLSVALFLSLSFMFSTFVHAQCSSSCDFASAPAVSSCGYSAPSSCGGSFISAPAVQNFTGYVSTNVQPAPLPQPQYTNYAPMAPAIVGGPIGSATPIAAPVYGTPINSAPIASAPIYNAPIYNAPIAQPVSSFPSQTFTSSPFGSLGTFQNFATPTCSGGNCPFR